MYDIYIIGTLSRFDEVQKAALHYLSLGYSVAIVRPQSDKSKEKLIAECFKSIEKCKKIVAVPHEDGTLGDGTLYEITYANKLGKCVSIWKNGPVADCLEKAVRDKKENNS
jgi:hypothetical protein